VGDIVSLDDLGLVGTLVRNAPTLGEMIGDLIAHHHRYVEGALFYVMPMGNEFLIGYAVYQPGTRGAPEFVDAVVAASVAVLRDLGLPSPLEVLLSRDPPADPEAYHAHFPMPVRFSTEMSGVVLPRDALTEPTPGADPAIRAKAIDDVESYWAAGTPDVLSRLRRAFFPDIMFGAVTQEGAANRLGLTPRAMSRQLKEAGTSFREELERTRFELARQLLANTSLPVPQISAAIGYSGPGVFARTFRRWTGATPLEWRESNRPQPMAS
jgi:AraC-like DNA-binding protein